MSCSAVPDMSRTVPEIETPAGTVMPMDVPGAVAFVGVACDGSVVSVVPLRQPDVQA